MKVTYDMPELPKGYRYTGELRKIHYGEMYLNSKDNIAIRTDPSCTKLKFPVIRFAGIPNSDSPVVTNDIVKMMESALIERYGENREVS